MGQASGNVPLREQLKRERDAVLARWRQRILQSYPEETARFLAHEKDEFANPVGHALHRDTEALLDLMIEPLDLQRAIPALDGIVRIRSVQGFCPSESLRFILALKQVVREQLAASPQMAATAKELQEFDSQVDELLLAAFDVFVTCRDKVHEVAHAQLKKSVQVLIDRANRAPARAAGAEAKGST